MSTPPSVREILQLYRGILRYGKQLQYTDKTYFIERIRTEFRKNKFISNTEDQIFQYKAWLYCKTDGFFRMLSALGITIGHHLHTLPSPTRMVIRCFADIIDYSRVPVLKEDDLEEMFVRGSGPGGQAVQKTSNCVVLKHVPTGVVVKCHKTRSLIENRKHARTQMVAALDRKLNGEMCVEAQQKRHGRLIAEKRNERDRLRREKKAAWKKSLEHDENKEI